MTSRERLSAEAIGSFLAAHTGWSATGEALAKTFAFPDYRAALAFVVAVAMTADKRDHHPDMTLTYNRVKVLWTTHDAGGITALDTELAEESERLAA